MTGPELDPLGADSVVCEDPKRAILLAILAQMPEEAFGYVLLALADVVRTHEANHGFMPASTASFVALARAVNAAAEAPLIDLDRVREHNPRLFDQ